MNLHNIKQQSIVDYLQQQGHSPQHIRGNAYWYCSPLRNEQIASFKVNTERNQWYDFATGEHGDIIDLVCILRHCSIAEAMKHLSSASNTSIVKFSTPATPSFSFGGTKTSAQQGLDFFSVQFISNLQLQRYGSERGVSLFQLEKYCSEVRYRSGERSYYALGFPNDTGGSYAIPTSKAASPRKL